MAGKPTTGHVVLLDAIRDRESLPASLPPRLLGRHGNVTLKLVSREAIERERHTWDTDIEREEEESEFLLLPFLFFFLPAARLYLF